jgi:hypothetical protein
VQLDRSLPCWAGAPPIDNAFGLSFCLAVPELTRSAGIQLNARVSLQRPVDQLSTLHRTISPNSPAPRAKPPAIILRMAALFVFASPSPKSILYLSRGSDGQAPHGRAFAKRNGNSGWRGRPSAVTACALAFRAPVGIAALGLGSLITLRRIF